MIVLLIRALVFAFVNLHSLSFQTLITPFNGNWPWGKPFTAESVVMFNFEADEDT